MPVQLLRETKLKIVEELLKITNRSPSQKEKNQLLKSYLSYDLGKLLSKEQLVDVLEPVFNEFKNKELSYERKIAMLLKVLNEISIKVTPYAHCYILSGSPLHDLYSKYLEDNPSTSWNSVSEYRPTLVGSNIIKGTPLEIKFLEGEEFVSIKAPVDHKSSYAYYHDVVTLALDTLVKDEKFLDRLENMYEYDLKYAYVDLDKKLTKLRNMQKKVDDLKTDLDKRALSLYEVSGIMRAKVKKQ